MNVISKEKNVPLIGCHKIKMYKKIYNKFNVNMLHVINEKKK